MKGYLLVFLLACAGSLPLAAQISDAQLWENINVEKNINPRLVARIVQEGRFTENYTKPSYNYFDVGASYKLTKHIHATLAYVWVEKRLIDDTWSPRHQIYGYLTFRKKLGDFLINDRQMLLWQVKDYGTSRYGRYADYYLRNKFTIRYDKSFKWAPYIAEELYYKASSTDYIGYRFDRLRLFAGLFYRLDKYDELEAYYLVEQHLNTSNPQTNWVIGLGYTHSFH